MGGAKRMMEEADTAYAVGQAIAEHAKVLVPCPMHGDLIYHGAEKESAYKLASAMFRDKDPLVEGMERQAILDGVKDAIEDAGLQCSSCEKTPIADATFTRSTSGTAPR